MKNPEIDEWGNKYWRNDKGQFHREDGPAIELSWSNKEWYINGKLHREDRPAVEYIDGDKAWWYNNNKIGDSINGFTQEGFNRYLRELKIKEYW